MSEMSWPMKNSRKLRCRRARNAERSLDASVETGGIGPLTILRLLGHFGPYGGSQRLAGSVIYDVSCGRYCIPQPSWCNLIGFPRLVARFMRLRILYHDHCFDGAASAAYFSRFIEGAFYPGAEFAYTGMAHRASQLFEPELFDGDENAIVDFKY